VIGEPDGPGPGQVGGFAKAAAVEKAADSAEDERQHQANGEDVQVTADGEIVAPEVEDDDGDSQKHTAKELKASLPNSKNREQTSAKEVEMVDYEEQAGAEDSGDQRVECGVGDVLWVRGDVATEASYEGNGGEETDDHHKPIAGYIPIDKRNFEEYRMHLSIADSV
jgi:hypothetical protein